MDVLKSERLAVITGADGGMGQEITRAVALQGYHVIMACYNMVKAESKRVKLVNETGNNMIECLHLDLYTMDSVVLFAKELLLLLENDTPEQIEMFYRFNKEGFCTLFP